MKSKFFFAFVLFALATGNLYAQPAGDKQINPYHKHYADSLKAMDYKPIFPIWGAKAYKKGFDVPYPYGISPTFFYMRQSIDITATKIGFNGGEKADLSGVIKYGDVMNTTNVITIRPDVWIFPFLNVYAVAGYGTSSVVVPVTAIGDQPLDFSTTQHFGVSSLGFGVTLAGGIGPVFLTLDNNMNWAKVDVVEKAVPAYNLDVRVGHCFVNAFRPDRNVTVWVGAFMQTLQSATVGDIKMSDVMSPDEAQKIRDRIDASGLGPVQKQILNNGIDNLETATVNYELDKKIAAPWNMIVGVQYQHNKRWQGRVEIGTLGKRTQLMLNLNYRFY